MYDPMSSPHDSQKRKKKKNMSWTLGMSFFSHSVSIFTEIPFLLPAQFARKFEDTVEGRKLTIVLQAYFETLPQRGTDHWSQGT